MGSAIPTSAVHLSLSLNTKNSLRGQIIVQHFWNLQRKEQKKKEGFHIVIQPVPTALFFQPPSPKLSGGFPVRCINFELNMQKKKKKEHIKAATIGLLLCAPGCQSVSRLFA